MCTKGSRRSGAPLGGLDGAGGGVVVVAVAAARGVALLLLEVRGVAALLGDEAVLLLEREEPRGLELGRRVLLLARRRGGDGLVHEVGVERRDRLGDGALRGAAVGRRRRPLEREGLRHDQERDRQLAERGEVEPARELRVVLRLGEADAAHAAVRAGLLHLLARERVEALVDDPPVVRAQVADARPEQVPEERVRAVGVQAHVLAEAHELRARQVVEHEVVAERLGDARRVLRARLARARLGHEVGELGRRRPALGAVLPPAAPA